MKTCHILFSIIFYVVTNMIESNTIFFNIFTVGIRQIDTRSP